MKVRKISIGVLIVASLTIGCSDSRSPVDASGSAGKPPKTAKADQADPWDSDTGTSNVTPDHGADVTGDNGPAAQPVQKPKKKRGKFDPPDEMPTVLLSGKHLESCLVKQGDTMPLLKLKDPDGAEVDLSTLFGDQLTVVCFWSSKLPLAGSQLADLGPDVVKRYGKFGVNVVAVNYGETAEEAKAAAADAEVAYPILLDEDGKGFAQIATRYLPRTYLVDASGKILWFDLEYASETRRHLDLAIRYALAEADKQAAN